jgi:hypothetical protein
LEQALWEAASSTFEQTVFVFAEPGLSDEQERAPVDATARVEFQGPFRGALWLRVAGGVLPMLATNMLGEADPPAEPMQLDALGEIANMVCGSLLGHIGEGQEFRQAPPSLAVGCTAADRAGAPAAVLRLGLEQGCAELLLFLEGSGGGEPQ